MQTTAGIEARLRAKADSDPAFRAQLKSDPKGAIEGATGLVIPDGFNIHVHEQSSNERHLVLTPAGGRLSDDEMSQASGGLSGQAW